MTQTSTRLVLNSAGITLIPLREPEERLYAAGDKKLPTLLGMPLHSYSLPIELPHVIQSFILPLFKREPSMYLFYTSWLIVDSSTQQIIGDLSFKGRPNRRGRVEVGYGIFEEFRNKGCMTKALQTLCDWAVEQPAVREVTAETLITNVASARVLEKNDFRPYTTRGLFKYWIKYV